MADLKEIETKWNADQVSRNGYNASVRSYLKKRKVSYKFLQVDGFDYYFSSDSGHVIRHRVSRNTNELTVKARTSKTSIKVRAEGNVRLAKDNEIKEVHGTYNLLGFREVFAIYKDCDIYFITDGKADLSVVWYVVKKKGSQDRIFLEVEVHGMSLKQSVKKLKEWEHIIKDLFKLGSKDINPKSLYEIYSGKQYRMAADGK